MGYLRECRSHRTAGGLKTGLMVFGFVGRFHDDGQTFFLAHFVQGKNGAAQNMRGFVQWIIVEDS